MEGNRDIIDIGAGTRLTDIQELFATAYPYLAVHFFIPGKEDTRFHDAIDPKGFLGTRLEGKTPCQVSIVGTTTVSQLVDVLQKLLGLTVHICRKSGKVWNLISVTGGWTLEEQNNAGAFICKEMLKNGSGT